MKSLLYTQYTQRILPELMKDAHFANRLAAPRLEKVVVNIGIGKIARDDKTIERITSTLQKISGQKPVRRLARKSIASFKVREGMVVGLMVTFRGERMYHFVEKLIHIVFPRIRDFRGIDPASVDRQGNLSVGVREQAIFPEIETEDLEVVHGLQITIHTTAKTREQGMTLLSLLGFPFAKPEIEEKKR